jgi:hypothetical protein
VTNGWSWLVVCSQHISHLSQHSPFSFPRPKHRSLSRKDIRDLTIHLFPSRTNMPIEPKTKDFVPGGKWLDAPGDSMILSKTVASQQLTSRVDLHSGIFALAMAARSSQV